MNASVVSLFAAALITAGPVAAARPPLQVASPLPRFLAPGATLVVRGWTGRALRVRLVLGGQTVDATASGRLGGFTLRVTVSRPGRYVVAVTAPGERRKVGTLVVRPLVRPAPGRIVAWSLGNFVFPPHSPGTDRTGVLLIKLGSSGVRGHLFRPARIVGVQPRF